MSTASVLQAAAGTFSTAESCLTPSTACLTAAKPCNSFLPFPARSIRVFHLSCASSLSLARHQFLLCLKRRGPLLPLVAQTSDWAQQGGSQVEEASVDEAEADLSEWDGEEETVGVEDVMGAAAEEEEAEASGDVTAEEEVYQEPPADAKLFVGNLPYDMDSEKLAHLFEEAGVVEVAEVIYNRETDQSRGFGFVTMSTVEEAEQAIEKFHRYDVDGKLLTVNKAAPRGSRPERTPREFEPSFRIYVGNLPWSVDDALLEQAFSEYGKVVASRVVYERETGRSRGFGFVTMSTQQEMDDAIAGLDGNDLGGRTVRVNAADRRPPRRSF